MPRRLPRSLTLAAALTLGGGMAASFGLFIGVSHLEYDNMALAFGQRADQRVAAVRQGMGSPQCAGWRMSASGRSNRAHPSGVSVLFERIARAGERASSPANLTSSLGASTSYVPRPMMIRLLRLRVIWPCARAASPVIH